MSAESKVAAPVGGVDVLAAIEDSISECNDVTCPQCMRLAKARAAVAELIAAGQRVTAAFRAIGSSPTLGTPAGLRAEAEAAMLALDAALAKVASNGDTK